MFKCNHNDPLGSQAALARELRARFEQTQDTTHKSAKIFLRVLDDHKFHSGGGATKSRWQKAAILDFKDGHHVISINANISASKPLKRSILMSKYIFSGTRNAMKV